MGTSTTLYAEDGGVIAAFEAEGALDFGEGPSLFLDKAAPILSLLLGADTGRNELHYSDCQSEGDACFRGLAPDDVKMLLQRCSGGTIAANLAAIDWDKEVADRVYPFGAQDKKADCQAYFLEHGAALQEFLAAAVQAEHGIMSVEC